MNTSLFAGLKELNSAHYSDHTEQAINTVNFTGVGAACPQSQHLRDRSQSCEFKVGIA